MVVVSDWLRLLQPPLFLSSVFNTITLNFHAYSQTHTFGQVNKQTPHWEIAQHLISQQSMTFRILQTVNGIVYIYIHLIIWAFKTIKYRHVHSWLFWKLDQSFVTNYNESQNACKVIYIWWIWIWSFLLAMMYTVEPFWYVLAYGCV